MNAAIDLFGVNSPQLQSVMDAWYAVGVYQPYLGPYAQNAVINANYLRPETDTLQMTSKVFNPQNHRLQVNSIIESFDGSISDTVQLFDDGVHNDSIASDNIYGGSWAVRPGERSYNIHIKTLSLDSGYYNILPNASRFTTIGPLVIQSFQKTAQSGDDISYQIVLKNSGVSATAEKITAELQTDDPFVTGITNNSQNFGNITAGQTAGHKDAYIVSTSNLPAEHTIVFKLNIYSNDNHYWSDSSDVLVGIKAADNNSPRIFALRQNFPNPFNPRTIINYELAIMNDVELSIYNLLGQKVAMLVSERQDAGHHQVEWDATGFASGVYYYRLQAGEFLDVKKMVLIR
jgi:hypothetical protein